MEVIESFLISHYLWIKSFHIISIISWMAGLFYLPRLYVYHTEGFQKSGVKPKSEMDFLFQHQEKLLLKAIMNPAMILSWFFGLCLVITPGIINWGSYWVWSKGICIVLMTLFHFWLSKKRKEFLHNNNKLSGNFYRLINEIPTVLMIIIILSIILKFGK